MDNLQLKPASTNLPVPELFPAIELDAVTKEKLQTVFQEVSMSRQILSNRKEIKRFESEKKSYSEFLIAMTEVDHIAGFYERQLTDFTKKYGPNDVRVINLKKEYSTHKERRDEALSKTTEELKAEVAYVDQLNFDTLKQVLEKHAAAKIEIEEAMKSWNTLDWLESTDCTNKLYPKNRMIVKRNTSYVEVKTGKVLPSQYFRHPKSFHVHSIAIVPDEKYAFIQSYSHPGGSSYHIGRPPPTYLLKQDNNAWQVIAVSGNTPVFY